MRFIKTETHFDFIGKGRISTVASGLAVLAGIVAFFTLGGLNYGIDFSGGTLVQVQLKEPVDITTLRSALGEGGVPSFSIQSFGEAGANEYLISLGRQGGARAGGVTNPGGQVEQVLKASFPSLTVRRIESVGPRVGGELRQAASLAIVFSVVLIVCYVWLRFHWRFSIGALVALFHDVLIVLGAFVLLQKEVTLPVVAAILTVAGYSINDTIVIFDRVRENMRRYQKRSPLENINQSINQTLSRTLLTSGTTLFVVAAIFFFGGDIINDFAFALLVGVIVGTYSSVFIAAPVVHALLFWFPPKIR